MTQVLSASIQSKNPYYSSSPLKRSSSHSSYLGSASGHTYAKPRRSHIDDFDDDLTPSTSDSESRFSSSLSTPATIHSIDPSLESERDDITISFPTYDDVGYFDHLEIERPVSPRSEPCPPSPSNPSGSCTPSTAISGPEPPDLERTAGDDTAVRIEPTRHVDYLSHDWREEDVWTSWRYMVQMRKAYANSSRLENASWRSWMKTKNNLKTVSPERLNWLKDCDVTWLYGPLQVGPYQPEFPADTNNQRATLDKKPILKKRSMSEIMLQRSLSTSSLLKQAAAVIQSQKQAEASHNFSSTRPNIGRGQSDFGNYAFFSNSATQSSTIPSSTSSELESPVSYQKKHIHFNDTVDQCIAIDGDGADGDDDDYYSKTHDSDDEGLVFMKTSTRKRRKARSRPRSSISSETKTIAILPSTSLKYRNDTPEPAKNDRSLRNVSPSPSLETLRPTKHSIGSTIFSADGDDEDVNWNPSPPASTPTFGSSDHLNRYGIEVGEGSGLRRTASGMFMPYESEDEDAMNAGLFGKVVDTVNTAKDIAHVIWNVGWRK